MELETGFRADVKERYGVDLPRGATPLYAQTARTVVSTVEMAEVRARNGNYEGTQEAFRIAEMHIDYLANHGTAEDKGLSGTWPLRGIVDASARRVEESQRRTHERLRSLVV